MIGFVFGFIAGCFAVAACWAVSLWMDRAVFDSETKFGELND